MKSLKTGVALALTALLAYVLCTVIALIWPNPSIQFVDALFHGMDFQKLSGPEPYTWSQFFEAAVILSVWALAIGTFFEWLRGMMFQAK